MAYYHLRYNIYPDPGFPVEKESWITLSSHFNEQQVKLLLITQHQSNVSIITCIKICKEEYDSKVSRETVLMNKKLEVDFNKINEWRLSRPSNTLKNLNHAAEADEIRYRNISAPDPLL
jgi:hypothetical protein